ncbi:MAG: dynamin family protein [bacterium]|nr:MAG: dynamin family protein [bacterium]
MTRGKTAQRDSSGLEELLQRALNLLTAMGGESSAPALNLLSIRDRLVTESFHLAVLGQFKRGKSTLLNALLGQEILPTSVVPLTAIPTFVRWGSSLRARIVFTGDRPVQEYESTDGKDLTGFLSRFVTEEDNPQNSLGVLQAEVFHPADILARGLVLIDTPGIGSTYQHNTETTLNFLPQCDAALFLVSADPPVTEVELAFLKEVKRKIARLFFIFNKVDYLRDADREKALAFFRGILETEVRIDGKIPIFPLSARDGLEARLNGDEKLLAGSGLAKVQHHLVDFLMNQKSKVLRGALARKAEDVIAQVRMGEDLKVRSLQMPLENLEERLGVLENKIGEAGRQRITAEDLLRGDRKRALAMLERQSEKLRGKAGDYLGNIVSAALSGSTGGSSLERSARRALSEAIPGFFEHELGDLSAEFDRHVTEVLRPHQRRADDLIEKVRKAAAELFDVPYHAPESSEVFETTSQPYWVTHKWNASLNPVPAGLLDWLLPGSIKRSVLVKRFMRQMDDLILHNVENLRWATLQNLDRAFRLFTTSLDERLQETIAATQGAVKAAMARRREHAERTADDLAAILTRVEELEEVMSGFGELAG